MILQALVKYYEMMAAEDKLPKQGYCTGKVSYALELSGEGELCGITTLRLPVEHGKKKGDAAQLLEVPEQESRSVNIQIGRASCRERVTSWCRSRWSPYH